MKLWHIRKFIRETGGAVTVEFVASVPVLLAALAVCLELGRAFLSYEIATTDLQAAARYASRLPSLSGNYATMVQNVAMCGQATTGTCTKHWPWTSSDTAAPTITVMPYCTLANGCITWNSVSSYYQPFNQDVSYVTLDGQIHMTLGLLGYIGLNKLYVMRIVDNTMWIGS